MSAPFTPTTEHLQKTKEAMETISPEWQGLPEAMAQLGVAMTLCYPIADAHTRGRFDEAIRNFADLAKTLNCVVDGYNKACQRERKRPWWGRRKSR